MTNPEDIKIQPPNPYVFKSLFKRKAMAFFDFLGEIVFFRKSKPVDWKNVKRIAVLRLDHLGDVILALPFVEILTRVAPQAEVDFYVGPWSEEVIRLSGLPVNCRVFRASWFDRAESPDRSKAGVSELTKVLSRENYDIAFDLRGDFRHILAMWKAKIPVRVGQVITGGRFLLTDPAVYHADLHEVEQNLNLLATVGVIVEGKKAAHFHLDEKALKEARKVKTDLGLTKPIIVLHAICAATAKRWSISNWKLLIESLPDEFDLVMVGTENERTGIEEIIKASSRKVFLASGMGLSGLAAFLAEAKLFIGVDSGPAHIAAAMGTPVLSLFSGTNRASQWQPRGDRVVVVQKQTPCSPCALSICPLGNECMEMITVGEVLKITNSILN